MRFITAAIFSFVILAISPLVMADQQAEAAEEAEGALAKEWDMDLEDEETKIKSVKESEKHQYASAADEQPRTNNCKNFKSGFCEDYGDE